ncbi:MAG TPA: hypothetical protein VJR03_03075, partial [Nitrospira sp.]|nr:hypothetical protein [Nitrospira sp.]
PPEARRPPVITAHWIHPLLPLPANAGMHRFVWDLRYGSPPGSDSASAGFFAPPRGPMALPGSYQVRLIVEGRTYSQPLTVVMDPRVKVSNADLVAQMDFEQGVLSALARIGRTSTEIGKLRSELSAARKQLEGRAEAKAVGTAAADIDHKAAAILQGTETGGSEAPSRSLMRLRSALAQILSVADSTDGTPTAQSRKALEEAERQLDAAIAAWDELKSKSLPALNDLLRRNGVPAVDTSARN